MAQQARALGHGSPGQGAVTAESGDIAGELAGLRAAAASNEVLRSDAGRKLSESYAELAAGDLSAEVRATPVWHRGTRYCYDVEIEVPFEDDAGRRVMWQQPNPSWPQGPCARVLAVRRLVVDLAALTPEQICAAYPYGYDFFPGPQGLQAQQAVLADLTRPGTRPDVFVCAELPDWNGYRERARGIVPRLLRVIADGDQIKQARQANGQPAPNGPGDFPAPVDLSRAARTGAGRRARPQSATARPRSQPPELGRG